MDIDPTMVDPDEFSDLKDLWESTKVGSSEDLLRVHGMLQTLEEGVNILSLVWIVPLGKVSPVLGIKSEYCYSDGAGIKDEGQYTASGLGEVECGWMIPVLESREQNCYPDATQASQRTSKSEHWLLSKLDLSGTSSWSPELQAKAKSLFIEHQDSFSKNDTDLGRTDLVKHNIILTDPKPFKERFQIYSTSII